MKYLCKRVGKPLEVAETTERWFMDCVHGLFGPLVYTERVYLDGYEFIMVVDEDGLRKRLPLNFFMAFENPVWPIQAIVGDVFFLRNKPLHAIGEIEDWEIDDVREDDIDRIQKVLDPRVQAHLSREFQRRQKA